MLPDRVSNPGPLTYDSGAVPIALRGPAPFYKVIENFVEHGRRCLPFSLKFAMTLLSAIVLHK